jgi:hypothetical protein
VAVALEFKVVSGSLELTAVAAQSVTLLQVELVVQAVVGLAEAKP